MLVALTDPRDVYEPAGAAPEVGQETKGIKKFFENPLTKKVGGGIIWHIENR